MCVAMNQLFPPRILHPRAALPAVSATKQKLPSSQGCILAIPEATMSSKEISASLAGTVSLGGELTVHRLGFGAMRLTDRAFGALRRIARRRSPFFVAPWS